MTNKEWLDYLAHNAPDELAAWFDAEHVENQERALDGDTEPENEDSREKLEADVRKHYAYSTTTLMYPPSANKTTDILTALIVVVMLLGCAALVKFLITYLVGI